MGDVELLCDRAPIEVGNRIWRDTDGDGVQDAGELPIAGVIVHLYDANNVLIGTAVTDSNGEYYFVGSTSADTNTNDNIGQVNGGILPNTAYQVRIPSSEFGTGRPLNGLFLTFANSDAATNGDSRDSDGTLSSGNVVYNFNTGGAGENNHTVDFGFRLSPTAATVPVSGRIQAADGRGIRNVIVSLTNANGQTISTRTGTFGYYRFDNVEVGQNVTVSVRAKRFTFSEPTRIIAVEDAVENLIFTADGENAALPSVESSINQIKSKLSEK